MSEKVWKSPFWRGYVLGGSTAHVVLGLLTFVIGIAFWRWSLIVLGAAAFLVGGIILLKALETGKSTDSDSQTPETQIGDSHA